MRRVQTFDYNKKEVIGLLLSMSKKEAATLYIVLQSAYSAEKANGATREKLLTLETILAKLENLFKK